MEGIRSDDTAVLEMPDLIEELLEEEKSWR
jgi:hypothetical protein